MNGLFLGSVRVHKIKDVFIVLTSRFTDSQIEFPAISKIIEVRAKKEFNATKLNLSIRNNGRSIDPKLIKQWTILLSWQFEFYLELVVESHHKQYGNLAQVTKRIDYDIKHGVESTLQTNA